MYGNKHDDDVEKGFIPKGVFREFNNEQFEFLVI